MRKSPGVVVVSGGPGGEAEVSRVSGREVAAALRTRFSRVRELELDAGVAAGLVAGRAAGGGVGAGAGSDEVVFPALHGPPGEDGCFQGLLEILGLPYVGSDVRASAAAMDKTIAKELFRRAALPVARDAVLRRDDAAPARELVLSVLGERLVLKPSGQGSALGVTFVERAAELGPKLEECFGYGGVVLVEEWIEGREVTCGVLEDPDPLALPVCEILTPAGSWYDYEHRYTEGLSTHVIPPDLPPEQLERIQEVAVAAHQALGCRDLSRVDFVVPQEGEPVLLEVNTLPGMTPTSLYPDEARASGRDFAALCEHLVLRAWARH